MREEIKVSDYAGRILKELKKGVLLTSKKDGEVNTMTISWGALGIEWNKPTFITYVRQGRHTHKLLESGEFTINIPVDNRDGNIMAYCGTKSAKDTNKIEDLKLTLVDGQNVDVPAIKELPLTLECKILYKQTQNLDEMPEYIQKHFYPQDVASEYHSANQDIHTAFYGEIVSSYILK